MHFLDRLRAKPKYVRTQYAFLCAVLVTAIFGAFWYASFLVKKDEPVAVPQDNKEKGRVAEQVKKFFSGLQEQLSDLRNEEADTTPSDSTDNPELTPASEIIIDPEFAPTSQATTSTTSKSVVPEQERKPVLIRTTSSAATTTDMGR